MLSVLGHDEKPRNIACQDFLFDKIKNSSFMVSGFTARNEGHKGKTYAYLKSTWCMELNVKAGIDRK